MSEIGDGASDRRQPRRWRILDAVTSVRTPATVDEITDQLHDRRAPSDPLAGLESWDRTHQRLHEVDLPALSAAGLLEFDRDRGIVTVPPEAAESGFGPANVEATLQRRADDADRADDEPATESGAEEGESGLGKESTSGGRTTSEATPATTAADGLPWHHLYLGATVVSALLLVGSTGWIAPGVDYATTVAAAAAVALFGLLAIGHELASAR